MSHANVQGASMLEASTVGHVVGGMALMCALIMLFQRFHRKLRYDYRTEWMRFSLMHVNDGRVKAERQCPPIQKSLRHQG